MQEESGGEDGVLGEVGIAERAWTCARGGRGATGVEGRIERGTRS